MKYLATSRYILLEDLVHSTAHMKVRKGQELIQLWHGPGETAGCGESGRGRGVCGGRPVPQSLHSAQDGGGSLLCVWSRGTCGCDCGACEGKRGPS